MPRAHARLLAAAMVLLTAVGTVGAVARPAAASHKQSPILECVYQDPVTKLWNSSWGYDNTSGSVETIAIGSNNFFSPGAQNQGQPTTFQPGQHDNVFTVTWNGSGSLTWTLNGQSASATTSSTKCSKNPVPLLPGTGGWGVALPLLLVAVGVAGVGWCCLRYDVDLLGLRRDRVPRDPPDGQRPPPPARVRSRSSRASPASRY